MKRHIGKIFEFSFEGALFHGICVTHDTNFGYMVGFIPDYTCELDLNANTDLDEHVFIYAFIYLDSLIRAKIARKISVVPDFKPSMPALRGGGGRRPDGSLKRWMIYKDGEWTGIEENDPALPYLSECVLADIGSVKDVLETGITRQEAFETALEKIYADSHSKPA